MEQAALKAPTDISSTQLMELRSHLQRLFVGKEQVIDTTLCALLSGGHLLLEDVPGVGKTTFIKALAKLLGLEVSRIQFTADLLPADIIGVEVFNGQSNKFEFHKGPIFANVIMADELNRASPRTQSALLEAMGEGNVTVDRKTHALPRPFIVIASQNPSDSLGTYELPESQLDRFAAKVIMGYPEKGRELEILKQASDKPLRDIPGSIFDVHALESLQAEVDAVHLSDSVINYAQRIIEASRSDANFSLGISTRGGVVWIRMARAYAKIEGRNFVTPDDLQHLAGPCLGHRIVPTGSMTETEIVRQLLDSVDI